LAYSALSIDTNILYRHGFDFEHGLVGQLARFAGSPTPFLLTDVVRREFLKHVREQTDKTHESLSNAARKALKQGLIRAGGESAVQACLEQLVDPQAAALSQVDRFIAMTAAAPVEDTMASTKDLMTLYFDGSPPFEAVGDKKAEFPDAVALLALEAWGRSNGKVLVVSRDAGWAKFAAASDFLDVVGNLGDALATIQQQEEVEATPKAILAVSDILTRMADGRLPGLSAQFDDALNTRLQELDLYPEGASTSDVEGELVEVVVDEQELVAQEDGGYAVKLVRLEPGRTVFTVPVRAELTVTASFTFYRWIWNDGHSPRGRQRVMRALSVDDEIMVTLRGRLDEPDALEVVDLELANPPSEVDFGEIELDDDELDRRRAALYTIID
jgi:hypothetical protein